MTDDQDYAAKVRALPNPYDEGSTSTSEAMLAVGFEKCRAAVLALLAAPAPSEPGCVRSEPGPDDLCNVHGTLWPCPYSREAEALRAAGWRHESEDAPAPSEPGLHPDDGHAHSFGCRLCGVDAPSEPELREALVAGVLTDLDYMAEDEGMGALTERDRTIADAAVRTALVRLAAPAPSEPGLDVERLARAEYAADGDPTISFEEQGEGTRRLWMKRASGHAAEYARRRGGL